MFSDKLVHGVVFSQGWWQALHHHFNGKRRHFLASSPTVPADRVSPFRLRLRIALTPSGAMRRRRWRGRPPSVEPELSFPPRRFNLTLSADAGYCTPPRGE